MGKSTVLKLTLLVIIFLSIPTSSDAGMTVQLERIEQIGGEHLVNSTMVRVRKFNRTTFTMNGTGILLLDLDETYEVSRNFMGGTKIQRFRFSNFLGKC